MILDSIDNIHNYRDMGAIYTALQDLVSRDPAIETGQYKISENILLIVSEYSTKTENTNKYEAHKCNIDVQYPAAGTEKVEWCNIQAMSPVSEYDVQKDRTYYKTDRQPAEMITGNNIFAVFFPEDAHNPCLSTDNMNPQKIRKFTYKIRTS